MIDNILKIMFAICVVLVVAGKAFGHLTIPFPDVVFYAVLIWIFLID